MPTRTSPPITSIRVPTREPSRRPTCSPTVVSAALDAPEVLVRVDLGLGDGSGEAFGCDLTEAYVVENSAYST